MPIDQTVFRTAMSRLGAAVNVVTTDGPAGRYGIVVSAVCSVTDSPPTVLVCVSRSSGANAVLKKNGVLAINILAGRHRELSIAIAKAAAHERFASGDWTTMETGAPVLDDAAVALDCHVSSVSEVGSHSVFFAGVDAIKVHDEVDGLVWFDRDYQRLQSTASTRV